MAISQYKVGSIPLRNLSINVRDSAGRSLNIAQYANISVRMLGSDNEEVDLTGAVVNRGGASQGKLVLEWPRDRSLFTKTGDYVLEVILRSANAVDITTSHTIRVTALGRLNK